MALIGATTSPPKRGRLQSTRRGPLLEPNRASRCSWREIVAAPTDTPPTHGSVWARHHHRRPASWSAFRCAHVTPPVNSRHRMSASHDFRRSLVFVMQEAPRAVDNRSEHAWAEKSLAVQGPPCLNCTRRLAYLWDATSGLGGRLNASSTSDWKSACRFCCHGSDGLGVANPRHQLEADYYDSPGLSLAQIGVTLRHSVGGEDEGWHVKVPSGRDTRTEHWRPLGTAAAPVARLREDPFAGPFPRSSSPRRLWWSLRMALGDPRT